MIGAQLDDTLRSAPMPDGPALVNVGVADRAVPAADHRAAAVGRVLNWFRSFVAQLVIPATQEP